MTNTNEMNEKSRGTGNRTEKKIGQHRVRGEKQVLKPDEFPYLFPFPFHLALESASLKVYY